ncbi:MAG: hypothetical protein JOZ20_07170 [Sphingomonas sp.]|nr:hypothetical protein [Sphingomonas sp.]MBW0008225.1 hypothetical protein [Sphingomonas sp.]
MTGTRDGALPPGLRKTASDRPGQAQPVPTRDIPSRPWVKIGMFAFAGAALLTAGWEWNARERLQLRAGDINDSPQAWAEARRAADGAPVAIVGDSRILFDTDLERFRQMTGVKPVQVSHVGTNSRALLEHFANDPNFHGLLIVGMADTMYFGMPVIGLGGNAVHNYVKNGKPSQITGLWIDRWLQKYLAFMDSDYRLSLLTNRAIDFGVRKGVDSPYDDVWKISEDFPGRQYFMWHRIETDRFLQQHARYAWQGFNGPNVPPAVANKVIARSAEAVRRIRAHGGDVIFVRPPSAPQLRVNEQRRIPRALGWDRLLVGANAKGIHFDDLPEARNLVLPEWSHLSRKCAAVFTDAYVRRLVELTPRLKLRPDAPPPLTRADCVPSTIASR